MRRAYWDDEVSVLSAENVFFDIETAGLAARFGATVIDFTLQSIAATLLLVTGALFATYISPLEGWAVWMLNLTQAVGIVLLFFIFYAYYFFFEWLWDGQTPGKRFLKLRVMQADGMPITYWHALVRNVLRIADFLPFAYGAGALVALLNENNRRIGDLVADTVVARERGDLLRKRPLDIKTAVESFLAASTIRPLQPGGESTPDVSHSVTTAAPESSDGETALLQVRLDTQDYELLRDFLTRRDKLSSAARARLAHSLASRVTRKLELSTPPPAAEEELFLASIVEKLRGRM